MPHALNKAQQEAVDYTDSPLLIVAGAGTGKTTVVTQKIAKLLEEEKARPEEILALTFTEKAAAEMQERVDSLVPLGYTEMQISTFHSFCQRLLESYGLEIGLPNSFSLLTTTEAWLLVKKHMYDLPLEYYRPLGNPSRHIHALLSHFSKCKDELISPEEYLAYAENRALDTDTVPLDDASRLTEIANAYHAYNQLLLDTAALDFGDLIYYTVHLLDKRPHILGQLHSQFRYILVDEFQDVNYAQYELVERLARGAHTQLTVVGDDDQSIYAFRGASVSNILRFKDDYNNAKEVVLTENYRSGQHILDSAYTLITHNNPDRLEVKLGIDKKLQAGTDVQGEVLHIAESSLDEEVQHVIDDIIEQKKATDISWSDIALLVRANAHAEPYIAALDMAGIPYEFLSSSGLYHQPIVMDALHALKVLDSYKESASIYRLLQLPCVDFSERDMHELISFARKSSVPYYEALKHTEEAQLSAEGKKTAQTLVRVITSALQKARHEKPTVVLHHFFEEVGYFSYLRKEEEAGNRQVLRSIDHLKQFFDYIHSYEQVHRQADVRGFLEYFSEVLESGESGTIMQKEHVGDAIQIMTVHGSKGLEFSYVYVVNCVEERFPTRRKGGDIEVPSALVKEVLPEGDYHYQEERRLFYVAMTRAKKRLVLASSENYGGVRKKKLSRFVHELGETVATHGTAQHGGATYGDVRQKEELPLAQYDTLYQLPTAYSISQIQAFQSCPYKYKISYILKIPVKGSHYFSFGNTIHLTLQRFYEQIRIRNSATQASLFDAPAAASSTSDTIVAPPCEELLRIYEHAWIGDWYQDEMQRNGYYKKGRELLKAFYGENEGAWTVPVALEAPFKLHIGGYTIRGKIDRIDQLSDGTLSIIDYKTGAAKESLNADDKQQLLLYQKAAMELPRYRNIGSVSALTYAYVGEQQTISFLGTDKELQKFEDKIIQTLDTLHSTDFRSITREDGCGRCDICTAFL